MRFPSKLDISIIKFSVIGFFSKVLSQHNSIETCSVNTFFFYILDLVESSRYFTRDSDEPISALWEIVSNSPRSSGKSFKIRLDACKAKYLGKIPSAFGRSSKEKCEPVWIAPLQLDYRDRRQRRTKPKIFIQGSLQRLSMVLQASVFSTSRSDEGLQC